MTIRAINIQRGFRLLVSAPIVLVVGWGIAWLIGSLDLVLYSVWGFLALLASGMICLARTEMLSVCVLLVPFAAAVIGVHRGEEYWTKLWFWSVAPLFVALGAFGLWRSNRDRERKGRGETAEPGATDNPDDAQHLREDH